MSGKPSITTSDAVARGHRNRDGAARRSTRNPATRAADGALRDHETSTTCFSGRGRPRSRRPAGSWSHR